MTELTHKDALLEAASGGGWMLDGVDTGPDQSETRRWRRRDVSITATFVGPELRAADKFIFDTTAGRLPRLADTADVAGGQPTGVCAVIEWLAEQTADTKPGM